MFSNIFYQICIHDMRERGLEPDLSGFENHIEFRVVLPTKPVNYPIFTPKRQPHPMHFQILFRCNNLHIFKFQFLITNIVVYLMS